MNDKSRQHVNMLAYEASEKFLAERGGADSPAPMREALPALVARAYEVGYRQAYQAMRIHLEVAARGLAEHSERCKTEEGDEHEAATMEIWP